MHTTRLMSLIAAACFVGLAASICLTGCGGDSDAGQGTDTTGSVSGRTVDARTSLGLGNVRIAVGNTVQQGANSVFQQAGAALSTTPDGDWVVGGLAPGTYNTLRITPAEAIFGAQPDKSVNMTVVAGQTTVLAPILITDGVPPTPAGQ